MSGFAQKWTKTASEGIGSKVKGAVRTEGPIKPRLEHAVRSVQVQISKLNTASTKLRDRDKSIFTHVVGSIQKHDAQHATIFANELAEIRKMNRMVTQAQLALEQIVMRLNTVQDLGDIVVTLAPAMSVMRNVKTGLGSVLPQAEQEFGEVSNLLSGLLVDAGQVGNYTVNFETANEDAEKIVAEASAVAEQRIKDTLPELPSEIVEEGTEETSSY